MGQGFHRMISLFLTFVFILSALVTGTYGWQSLQTITNETAATIAQVRLQKKEKLPDGTETDIPVPGAAFYLFTAEGEQLGGRYVTDDMGTISLSLPAGSYYFEEDAPPPAFAFDSQNGESITQYPFAVPERGTEQVAVTAYNVRLAGSLSINKTVENADGSLLSEEQSAKEFIFTVSFSDNGAYSYQKTDGTSGELISGGTLTLSHGETALFEQIPAGVTYTVIEQEEEGYVISSSGHCGTITAGMSEADFVNTYSLDKPPQTPVKLTVTKQLAGEYPASDTEKEFEMTLILGGVSEDFTLKAGESKEFTLMPGDVYEIREKDYTAEGYSQSITEGFGTAGTSDIEATVTNTFAGTVMTEIAGEKTWEGVGLTDELLPESITLLLKDGDRVVEEAEVTPDENGRWLYRFTAPKYDAEGNEIAYTLEERPIESFRPSYNGFDIVNTYIPPAVVTFPSIFKTVEGDPPSALRFDFCITARDNAPMPEGVKNSFLTLSLTGGGELHPGEIRYTRPGTYVYTVTETADSQQGWLYDPSVYTVTVTVTEKDGGLTADTEISKGAEPADRIEFVNRYDATLPPQDTIVIEGWKTWHHGDNPEENRPTSIVVLIYGDGEIVLQWQVTEKDGWRYRFELPRYNAAGEEIIYTVDEAAVEDYEKTVEGYDLINTYQSHETPDPDINPPTGDDSNLWLWFALMLLSGSMLIILGRKNRRAE